MNAKLDTIRNVLLVGFGGIAGQAVAVLCTPVLTRLYAPESYGRWALLMSLVLIPGMLACLRYELAVLLPSSREDAANVFALCIGLTLLVAAGLGLCLPWVSHWFAASLGFSAVGQWLWSVPLLVLAHGVKQACVSWHTRMANFFRLSLVTMSLPLFTIAIQIAIPLAGGSADVNGLMLGSAAGHTIAAGVGLVFLYPNRRLFLSAVSWSRIRGMFGEYRNYPLYMTPRTILSEMRNRLAVFFFGAFGQPVALGYYSFSEKTLRASINGVTNAIRPVFFQKAAADRLQNLQVPLLHSLRFINKAATPVFVLFLLQHARIYEIVFGAEWRDASVYGVILSVPLFLLLHTNWLDRGMDVAGRQRLAFLLELIFSVLMIAMLIAGLVVGGSVFYGVLLQCATFAVYKAVWLLVFFRVAEFDLRGIGRLAVQFLISAAAWTSLYLALDAGLPALYAMGLYLTCVCVAGVHLLRSEWRTIRESDSQSDSTEQATVVPSMALASSGASGPSKANEEKTVRCA